MFKTRCIRHKYSIIFFLFLFCYYGYTITRAYGFTFFPDEFGYWSYAAQAAGYDWSDITSLGSYYSYGYSLILIPVFNLFHNAVTAYRVAVTLNFIFLGISYCLLLGIETNLDHKADTDKKELFAAIAMLYPSWLFYARSTMVEVLLVFTFLLSCWLLQEYMRKKKLLFLIGYILSLAYGYFLHMRAVGVLIAGIVALVAAFVQTRGANRRNKHMGNVLLVIMLLLVLLGTGYCLKQIIGHSLYGSSTENISINDYSGQLDKIRYLFTRDGMQDGICGLAGKLLYTGIATFGLAWFGFIRIVKKIWGKSENMVCYLFTGLSLLAEIAINTIFNIRPLRVDSVVYGRYHEFVFPVLIVIGLWEIIYGRKTFVKIATIILLQLPLVWMTVTLIQKYQLTNIHGYVMIGMSFLHYIGEYEPTRLIWMTYLFHIMIAALITTVVDVTRKRKEWNFLLIGIWAVEIIFAMRASSLYLDVSAQGAFRDTFIADKIEELRIDNTEGKLLYIDEDDNTLISIMQFMLRDENIIVLPRKDTIENYSGEEMSADDMVLIDYRSNFGTELGKMYECSTMNGHFILYYNK